MSLIAVGRAGEGFRRAQRSAKKYKVYKSGKIKNEGLEP